MLVLCTVTLAVSALEIADTTTDISTVTTKQLTQRFKTPFFCDIAWWSLVEGEKGIMN